MSLPFAWEEALPRRLGSMKVHVMLLVSAPTWLSCHGPEPSTAESAWGAVEGVVRFVGAALPAPTRVENTTDPAICGREQTLDDLVVSKENRGIRHAIVALAGVRDGSFPTPSPERVAIDNAECRFSPHAAVTTVGSTLEALNSDPVLHTTHLYGPADVNISLPVKGARATRELATPGLYLVKCDIHGWMQAFVRVDHHPFHAVTDANGTFRIEGIPPGQYRLEVWHEKLGTQEMEVTVEEGKTLSISLEFPLSSEVKS